MWKQIAFLANVLAFAYIIYPRVRSGIQHRRGSWQRREWILFALVLSVPVMMIAVALAMGSAVDRGVYDEIPVQYHETYLWTMVGLALVGSGLLGCVLGWFASPYEGLKCRTQHEDTTAVPTPEAHP
jgi:hypothetical protein